MPSKIVRTLLFASMVAAKPAYANQITDNPTETAVKITHDYGESRSDWNIAIDGDCLIGDISADDEVFECTGETRILGPGGGDEMWISYQCQIPFHYLTGAKYEVRDEEIQCN